MSATFTLGRARTVVKSDTASIPFDWILCTTTGTIIVIYKGRDDEEFEETMTIPVNVWIPVAQAVAVKIASTATGLLQV